MCQLIIVHSKVPLEIVLSSALGIWAGINNTLNLASDITTFDIDAINFVI